MTVLSTPRRTMSARLPHCLLADLDLRYELDAPLAPLTSYRLGGPARVLAHPASVEQLARLHVRCLDAGVALYTLGRGANLLVADEGVGGVVVKLDDVAWRQLRVEEDVVTVGAGYDLMKLVLTTARSGLAGLEALAGIPATVGGAVRMNAGGIYGDTGRTLRSIGVMEANGRIAERDRDQMGIAYRQTKIAAPYVLEARFQLMPGDPVPLKRLVKEVFAYKKKSQPLADRSAGCTFTNPPGDFSAGALIERAGLKGCRLGGAEVSACHANFIFTHPGCCAGDVIGLMDRVQREVAKQLGVVLDRELVLWP